MDPPIQNKHKRDDSLGSSPSASVANGGIDLSLLKVLNKAQKNPIETLNLKTVKRLALSFERHLNANTASLLKYPDHPDKFDDSEVELHDELQKLKILVGALEFYPDLVNLGTVNSITGLRLLNHDNHDIAIDNVTLLQDNDEADALIGNNVAELLFQNLARLNDSNLDESAAIYNTLSTIESLIEVKPSVSELVC